MTTQQDHKVRIVALENLRAMCARASGMAHRYTVDSFSKSAVRITYSNPNECGSPRPMTMILRAYPSAWSGDRENPRVILEAGRVIHDTEDGEGWQSFEPVLNGPELFRYNSGVRVTWGTREEIEAVKG
jgi:hypothetical protein